MPKDIELHLKLNQNISSTVTLSGLLSPFNLVLVKDLVRQNKKVLYITQDEQSALKYQKDLESLFEIKSCILPISEVGLYGEFDKNYYIYREKLNALLKSPDIIFAPVKSLFERFNTPDFYQENSILLKKDETFNYDSLAKILVSFGYERTAQVTDIGEFALRGDILDIYTFYENPVRVEFFSDCVEDIRFFDIKNQKSFSHIENVEIFPLYKFILDDKNKENFISKIRKINHPHTDELIENIENQGYFEGIEYYLNYFLDNTCGVLNYLNNYTIIFDEKEAILSKYSALDEEEKNNYKEGINSSFLLPLDKFNHTEYEEFKSKISSHMCVNLDSFIQDETQKTIDFNMDLAPYFLSDIEKIIDFLREYQNKNYDIYICSNFDKRLKEIFKEYELPLSNIYFYPDISSKGSIWHKERIVFLSDRELFSKRNRDITTKKYYSNKTSSDYIDTINDIKENEYVVHSIHGIGIYKGLTKQTIDDKQKDYLEIQFEGSDKLFMPAEQINLLFRYRGSALKPKLSKMGGAQWENTKQKTKRELEMIAFDLLDLYAKRKLARGIEFLPDTTWQYEMEDNFEYIETPDQLKAIEDTKRDMEKDTPMDRLICADVGFGKTEIALRALFKAVMSGYQGAIIAPTTILTLQHYETLKERFEPYDVRVGILSRFQSKKEQKELVQKINEGTVDVVVATHRLLSDDIEFKKLGLLVVDEEHKFGVRQKEKLKKFKENIDVLSLSATPIPRTLNMALSGLKDISVINTPPKNRLPIKTYVGQFNEQYVKNAINQELRREGQVFYLYNRVETIENFKQKLQKIVPNARIEIAHGQMREGQLEDIMARFEKREFDILLCTTIIESGLDIPNANTIIIHDSVNFGLAQLYQLRGRVGRSERQAYCFCFYKNEQILNKEARSRLDAIKTFTNLGSGYKIAIRDIEIRGVGNILGTTQHGQMAAVGFDTYCNLLNECIEDIKNRKEGKTTRLEKRKPAIVDISADAYIPDDWAQTYEQKIIEYKRLSDVETMDELEDMKLNLKDRFSNIPDCVENLIKLIKLRILATSATISAVRETHAQIRIYTPFEEAEWRLLKSKMDYKISKYIQFTKAPKGLTNTKSILLINKNEDDFDEIFNKLQDLFYYISKTIMNFNY